VLAQIAEKCAFVGSDFYGAGGQSDAHCGIGTPAQTAGKSLGPMGRFDIGKYRPKDGLRVLVVDPFEHERENKRTPTLSSIFSWAATSSSLFAQSRTF
jgi:hypothetical protein